MDSYVAPLEELPERWRERLVEAEPERADAERYTVRMRDGVRLATDVYLPQPRAERMPAVLVRLCYDKCSDRTDTAAIARHFNERGYGVVLQDVRGAFRSEGERTPWLHEAEDGFDTIDWIVRQSWCDERVAMLGDSYLGFTQWAAAAAAHPGLRAVAPRVASELVPDAWFAADVASPAGVDWLARWWSAAGTLEGNVLDWGARPLLDIIPADLDNARRLHREFLSFNHAELHGAIYPSGPPAAKLTVPGLHTGAWFDVMTPYQLRDWTAASSRAPAAGDQYLVMGATDHTGYPFDLDGADAEGARLTVLERQLERTAEFFDRCLLGRGGHDAIPRVRYEIAGAGWRTAERWPPPGVREERLYLGGAERATRSEDGGDLHGEPGRRGEAHWTHEPANPVPSLIRADNSMLGPRLPDEREVHRRQDVLTFSGAPVDRPLDLVGPVALDLALASTAPSIHVVAMLTDVAPDGRAALVAEGIARVDTRYGTASATVQLGSTAYRIAPGHRPRLALSCSRYPRYLVHPGTDDNLWTAVEARPATQTLVTGGPDGSVLRVGTLES